MARALQTVYSTDDDTLESDDEEVWPPIRRPKSPITRSPIRPERWQTKQILCEQCRLNGKMSGAIELETDDEEYWKKDEDTSDTSYTHSTEESELNIKPTSVCEELRDLAESRQSLSTIKSKVNEREELQELSQYIGAGQQRQMDRMLNPNQFLLYHQITQDGTKRKLPLTIAYKTCFGDTHHYAIHKLLPPHDGTPFIGRRPYYYVQTGPRKPTCFSSLSALCRYYQVYSNSVIGPYCWWQGKDKKNIQRTSPRHHPMNKMKRNDRKGENK